MARKIIVAVTGLPGTLGQELYEWLSGDGYCVVGCSLSGETDLPAPVSQVDVRVESQVGNWFDSLPGDMYALVTCAGICKVAPSLEQTVWDFRDVMETNVTGTFLAVREAVRRGCKRVVTVSSILGGFPMGYPDRAAYIASKAAVAGLTRALAVEFAPLGVAINCVAPGHFSLMASKAKGLLEGALAKQPGGELVSAEKVAEVIAWLATDAPMCLTGQVIVCDGGYSLNQWPVYEEVQGSGGAGE